MLSTVFIILNLFIIEALLSVDNAAVLAVLVAKLPFKDRNKALRYGLIGAYLFRGLCLFIASWLVSVWWLKLIGGAYLIYLCYGHFSAASDTPEEIKDAEENWIFKTGRRVGLSPLWSTIILVEIMDIVFSIDNVFAAVALSNNIYIILTGVFMGILAMRFVAGWFVKIMAKYPSLTNSAFIVIGMLGIKLFATGIIDHTDSLISLRETIHNHYFDFGWSLLMMCIFFFPLLLAKGAQSEEIQEEGY